MTPTQNYTVTPGATPLYSLGVGTSLPQACGSAAVLIGHKRFKLVSLALPSPDVTRLSGPAPQPAPQDAHLQPRASALITFPPVYKTFSGKVTIPTVRVFPPFPTSVKLS